jgi:hypothetical protein
MALSIAVDAPPRAASRGLPASLRSTVPRHSGRANRPKVESVDRVYDLDEKPGRSFDH